ncbi:MAG: S4 domain-containing protein [Candidatus Eisenbacteria bacterium]|nr:S4 domain-containing protein [Candidatus Eisenbacteria bacterium]
MRIDLFLKRICIVKSRSAAARLCEEEKVAVNGKAAKSSKAVKPEDEVSVVLGPKELTFSIVALPEGNVSKAQAPSFYRITGLKLTPGVFE